LNKFENLTQLKERKIRRLIFDTTEIIHKSIDPYIRLFVAIFVSWPCSWV